mgnify:CR=1 FL=1
MFYYSNGSKYEGMWVENFKHGKGVFTFENGSFYDGPFENDRMINKEISEKDIASGINNEKGGSNKKEEKKSTSKETKTKNDA